MMLSKTEIQIDSQKLMSILARQFGEPVSELADWKIESLSGGLEQNHQLFHLAGEAVLASKATESMGNSTGNFLHPWSLVLKIVHPSPETENDAQGIRYWKREALAYQSGLLEGLSCGMTAPRCYEASQEGEDYWLWLEEVKDDMGKPWSLPQHYEIARNLGCSNGVYMAGKPLPQKSWLSHRWLRKYVEAAAPMVQILPELRRLPLFQRSFPHLNNDFLLEAWNQRGIFLEAIEKLPQTFCHQDAFVGNLFWRGQVGEKGMVVALDWAYIGIATVGEELAPLIAMSSFMLNIDQLFETCLEGYLAGLAESGWDGDPVQVRFGVLVTIFYRYMFGAGLGELWGGLRDESNHKVIAAAFGLPDVGILCDLYAAQNQAYLNYYTEARQFLAQFN